MYGSFWDVRTADLTQHADALAYHAAMAKGVPFETELVNLQDKPAWYKEMVPTNLVPAVKLHSDGAVVWESAEIMRVVEERFSDGADGSDGRASLRVACAIADRRASTQRSRSAGDRAWSRMVCCFSAQRTWRGTRSGLFLAKKKRDAAFRTLKGA